MTPFSPLRAVRIRSYCRPARRTASIQKQRKKTPITEPAYIPIVVLCQLLERKHESTVVQFQSMLTVVSFEVVAVYFCMIPP